MIVYYLGAKCEIKLSTIDKTDNRHLQLHHSLILIDRWENNRKANDRK